MCFFSAAQSDFAAFDPGACLVLVEQAVDVRDVVEKLKAGFV
jgi:hypothetical protein